MQAEQVTPRLFFVGVTGIQHLKSKLDAEQTSQNTEDNFEQVHVQKVEDLIKAYHGEGIKFAFKPFTDVVNHHGYFIIKDPQLAQHCLTLANEFTSEYYLQIWEGCSIIVREEPVGITKETAYFIDLVTLKRLIKSLENPSSQILPNFQSEEKELETVFKLTKKHLPRIVNAFKRNGWEFEHFGNKIPNPYALSSTSIRNLLVSLTKDHLVRVYRLVDLDFINTLALNPSIQSTTISMDNNHQPHQPPFLATLPPNFYEGPGIRFHPPPSIPMSMPTHGQINPERVPIYPHQMSNIHQNFGYPPSTWMTQNVPPSPIFQNPPTNQSYPFPPPPIFPVEYPQQPETTYQPYEPEPYQPQPYAPYPPSFQPEFENPSPQYLPQKNLPPSIPTLESATDQEHIAAVNKFLNKCGQRKNIPPAPPPPNISGNRSKSRSMSKSPTPKRSSRSRSQSEDWEHEIISQRRNSTSNRAKLNEKEKTISNSKSDSNSRSSSVCSKASQKSKKSRSKSPLEKNRVPKSKSPEIENREKGTKSTSKHERFEEKTEENFPKYKKTELLGEKTIWGKSFSVSFSENGEKLYINAKPGVSIDDGDLENLLKKLDKAFTETSSQITQTETILTKVPELKAAPQFGKRLAKEANNPNPGCQKLKPSMSIEFDSRPSEANLGKQMTQNLSKNTNPGCSKSFVEKTMDNKTNFEQGKNAIIQDKNVQSKKIDVIKQNLNMTSTFVKDSKVQDSKIVKGKENDEEKSEISETNRATLLSDSIQNVNADEFDTVAATSLSQKNVPQNIVKITSLAELRLRQMKKIEENKKEKSKK